MENKKEIKIVKYTALYLGKTWRKGTKTDPNKEYGMVTLNFVAQKNDGDCYTKTLSFFVDKDNFPQQEIELYSKVTCSFEVPAIPDGQFRFLKLEV